MLMIRVFAVGANVRDGLARVNHTKIGKTQRYDQEVTETRDEMAWILVRP